MTIMRILTGLLACLLLSSCSTFWEKDNTPTPAPLVQFTPKIKPMRLWDNRVSFDLNHENVKLTPVLTASSIVVADPNGVITAVNKSNGKTNWKAYTNSSVSGGPAVNDNLVVVGNRNGDVIALRPLEKKIFWKVNVGSEVLAAPAIQNNIVLVKSIDGLLSALAVTDGHLLWKHHEVEPSLILRGASAPQTTSGAVVVGYASGKIAKFSLKDGHELWSHTVTLPEGAFAIQRMIDIDADPIIFNNHVFAATYQGKIAAFNSTSGDTLWDQDISSYSGIAADESQVYVSDASSHVFAFDSANGRLIWKQTQLTARNLTGPVVVGNYIVVGDMEGVLHWLDKRDGSFAGRVQVSGSGIFANPVAEDKIVYAITKDGYLAAYTVG